MIIQSLSTSIQKVFLQFRLLIRSDIFIYFINYIFGLFVRLLLIFLDFSGLFHILRLDLFSLEYGLRSLSADFFYLFYLYLFHVLRHLSVQLLVLFGPMGSEWSSFSISPTLDSLAYPILLAKGKSDGLTDLFLAHHQLFLPLDTKKLLVNQIDCRLEFGAIVLFTISNRETNYSLKEETQLQLVQLVRCQG